MKLIQAYDVHNTPLFIHTSIPGGGRNIKT